MTADPDDMDTERFERALDRLAAHCELTARRSAAIEQRRTVVLAQLERKLGAELTRTLLTGLAPAG